MSLRNLTTINLLLVLISALAATIVATSKTPPGYEYLWILPLVFAVCSVFHLTRACFKFPRLFRLTFFLVAFLRYLVAPVLTVVSNQFSTWSVVTPQPEHYQIAAFLMAIELTACTLLIWLKDLRRRSDGPRASSLSLKGAEQRSPKCSLALDSNTQTWEVRDLCSRPLRQAYFVFGFFALVAGILVPEVRAYFTFVTPEAGAFSTVLESASWSSKVVIMLVITGKHLLFVAVLSFCYDSHKKTSSWLPVAIAIGAVCMNTLIYAGGNRLAMLIVGIASVATFLSLFPAYKKQIVGGGAVAIYITLTAMTEARNYYSYYSSYEGLERILRSYTDTLNHYLGGIANTAIGVQMTESLASDSRNLSGLLYDVTRPIVGFDAIFDLPDKYLLNETYNHFFFQQDHVSVIMPSISHGYHYFGFWLAVLVPLVIVAFGLFLERCITAVKTIDLYYIINVSLLRLGTMSGTNLTIQVNQLVVQLLVPLLVIGSFRAFFGAKTDA